MTLKKNSNFIKKRWKIQLLGILSSMVLILSFQNCSAINSPNSAESVAGSLSENDLINQKALDVLARKCESCHNPENAKGDISNIMDLNYLLYYRLVIPGQPEISDLIRVIKEGSMPPSGSITNAELESLTNWIQNGLVDNGTGVTLPGGGGQLEAKFSSLQIRIFNTKCVSCHNPANLDGGTDLSTFAGVKASVNANRLVASVERVGANFMPRNGSRLSADEIAKMKEWIMNGANND